MANRLINEQSPYLLQHAHNPVDWYPWCDDAFERAKKENKPVLVSIGYAACHWCHVMERESFENEEVAAYMNAHFINIKVDREEHPDVDHMYMDAVQAISGSGGWPLNAFVTPDRIPFYGGTYFPPRPAYGRLSWLEVLKRIDDIWHQQQSEVQAQTAQMLQYLKQASSVVVSAQNSGDWKKEDCRAMAENLLKQGDNEHGGFGQAPKFPGTMAISYLLEHYHFTKHELSLKHALFSLDAMIKGGIYDQLGGGFARYATDDKWLIPHFEKMLYDNALLVITLCDAYSIEKKPLYKKIIEETISFAERELRSPEGGYYSALDADSEGEEGKFYVWTWEEWGSVMGTEDELLMKYFGVSKEGNWEGVNILHVANDIDVLSKHTSVFRDEIVERIKEAKQKLFATRAKRIRPQTDDKCLLSWNALMNTALMKAAIALQDKQYLSRAEEHMQWMLDAYNSTGSLMHTWKQGTARITANLDDYAYLMQALLQLTSASGDDKWLLYANNLADKVVQEFLHEDGNFFYYTSDQQKDIPVRKIDLYDGALPSANAVMAHNLIILGLCMERNEFSEQAYNMLKSMAGVALRYTYSFSYWCQLLQKYKAEFKTIVITGPDTNKLHQQLQQFYIPHVYAITSKKEISEVPLGNLKFSSKESLIFVCTHQACLPPTPDIETALPYILAY